MKIEFKKTYSFKEFSNIFSNCVFCGKQCGFFSHNGMEEFGVLPAVSFRCNGCKFVAEYTDCLGQLWAGWKIGDWEVVMNLKGVFVNNRKTRTEHKCITKETNIDINDMLGTVEKYKVLV